MKEYWERRYSEQGLRTVGCNSFDADKFRIKTLEAQKLATRFLAGKDLKGKVLDLGCGWGRMMPVLMGSFQEICGIDISEWAIKEAGKMYPKFEFKIFDGVNIPYDSGIFDAVFSWTVLQHIPDPFPIMVEISRVIRHRGHFIYYENISTWKPNATHVWFRSAEWYENIFKGLHFRPIEAQIINRFDGNDEDHVLAIMEKL